MSVASFAAALPRALIFDVDGTLADTEEAHRLAFNATFERHGLDWRWSREQYRGLLKTSGGKERMAAYADTLGLPARERERLQYRIPVLHADKTRLYGDAVRAGALRLRPGIERLLQEARSAGCRLAIATTTTRANVEALLTSTLGRDADGLFELHDAGVDKADEHDRQRRGGLDRNCDDTAEGDALPLVRRHHPERFFQLSAGELFELRRENVHAEEEECKSASKREERKDVHVTDHRAFI